MSLLDGIVERERASPDAIALSFVQANVIHHWTYRSLGTLGRRIASQVASVASACPLAVVMAPTGACVAALLGMLGSRHQVVLMPPSMTVDETEQVVRAAGAEWLISPTADRSGVIHAQRDLAEGLILGHVRDQAPVPYSSSYDATLIHMTSGSMGASKLARRSLPSVQLECKAIIDRLWPSLGTADRDSVLCASSISHSYGCIGGLLAPLASGAHVLLAPSPGDIDVFRGMNPSILIGLAATYESLATSRRPAGALQPQLAFSAGAPLPEGLFDATLSRHGIAIRQDYGTTESGTIALDDGVEPDAKTVGKPLTHIDVEIIGAPVDPRGLAQEGEVVVHGSALADAYLIDGHPVPLPTEDGWYRTGDFGSVDALGRLRLTGRVRPPVRLARGSLMPDVIEDELAQLAGVVEAVVVPNGNGAITGFRAVVVAPGLARETIDAWLTQRLGEGAEPRIVDVVDSLPRSPAGKILQKYFSGLGETSAQPE